MLVSGIGAHDATPMDIFASNYCKRRTHGSFDAFRREIGRDTRHPVALLRFQLAFSYRLLLHPASRARCRQSGYDSRHGKRDLHVSLCTSTVTAQNASPFGVSLLNPFCDHSG